MWTLKHLFWLYFRMKGCFMVICFWKCTGLRKCFVFTEGSMQRWGTCLADYRQEAQISRIPCLCTFVCFKGSAKSDAWVPPGPTFTLRSKGIKDPGDNTNLMATSDMRRKSVCGEWAELDRRVWTSRKCRNSRDIPSFTDTVNAGIIHFTQTQAFLSLVRFM